MKRAMKKARVLVLAALFSGATILGMSQSGFASPLPLNNLNVEDNPRVLYNISPVLFKKLIDQVVTAFSPMVRMHGAELRANYLWNNSTVNAFANREGNVWYINMYGGLARRKEITPDGFSMVICHELGHHLAGYPFKFDPYGYGVSWAATEGQSDYFSTQTCARVIWGHDYEENAKHRLTVDPVAKQACDHAWGYQTQRDLCYRAADAGQSLANLLNYLEQAKRPVPVRYRDASNLVRVSKTDGSHPAAQCRLETYLNGAICRKPFDVRLIPGARAHFSGGSPFEEEKEAANYSCGERGTVYDGSRPRCWFQPLLPNWY